VRLSYSGTSVYDVEPQQLPNLYHGAPVRVYGRYRTGGTVAVKLEAEVLGAPLNQTVELTFPDRNERNPEIERMWASHRVERLMAVDRQAGTASSKDEITRLCEGYSIASEYASFIVLENDAEYRRWSIQRRNATRVSRDRSAQLALRKELDTIRESAIAKLGPEQKEGERSLSAAKPDSTRFTASRPTTLPTTSPSPSIVDSSRGRDIGVPVSTSTGNGGGGGAGGGAIDPITAAIALGLAGATLGAGRLGRRKRQS
jgi:hypothetical protein